ncbi:MAG: FliM/FliN family flagellar motor switch protein [Pseudomonadota bacterium]|nr:FliM/FliN family flagellar motor switch protein [Pseudomonadota bacterium]
MARTGGDRGDWLREGKQESATHGIEKSPQFRASIGRFADHAGERMSAMFGGLFTAASEASRNSRTFSTLTEHIAQPAVTLYSPTLDARMAMLCEGGLVDLLIGAMFGFDAANDAPAPAPPKAPTALELRMIGEVAAALAEAFRDAFAPVADFELAVQSTEIIEDDGLLGAKDSFALLAPLTIKAPTGAFGVTLLLPHPFLTPLLAAFARGPAPGATKLDPVWSSRMEQRVTEANLTLTAILDEFQMSLADVSSLQVGHILPLSDEGHGRVRIECGERGVFICSLGDRGGRYALEVEDIIARAPQSAYPANTPSA